MYKKIILILSLLLACTLSLLPMPSWAIGWQPIWVLLVLLYWSINLPQAVNLGTAWIMGILMDLLTGSLLGEHAFGFTLTIYFALRIQQRLRLYPLVQQSLSVGLFTLFYLFVLYCLQGFQGALPQYSYYWASALSSTLIWPWLAFILTDLRRSAKIS